MNQSYIMKKEDETLDLEKEAPLLFKITKENCFETPRGYFEELSSQIFAQIQLEDLVGKKDAFEVPDLYFEDLENQIINEVKIRDLVSKDGFSTPEGYFQQAQSALLNQTKTKSNKGKIIYFNLMRYAAAACILLTTSIGIYINIQHQENVSYQLSKIPDDAIENYLQTHTDASDVPAIIKNLDDKQVFSLDNQQLSEEEISNYLEQTP